MRECFSQREVPDTATDLQPPKEQILFDTGKYRAIGLEVPFADPELFLGHVMLNQDGIRHLSGFDRSSRDSRYYGRFSWCHDDFLHWLTSQVILNQKGELSQTRWFSQKQFFALRQALKVVIKIIIDIFTIGIYSLSFFNSFYELLRVVKIRIEKNAVSQ